MISFARIDFFFVLSLLFFSPLAGCIGADEVQEVIPIQELEELDDPCLIASQSVIQSMTSLTVN